MVKAQGISYLIEESSKVSSLSLSPYLFVLCTEHLSHLIQYIVKQGHWKPIYISTDGPPITHLRFANDLFIFTEALMDQVDTIKSYLDLFGLSSSQKVTKEKTKIFFSYNVHPSRATKIAEDLRKYLGVLLQHKRISAKSFSYVTNKLLNRLSSWKANALSLARRFTLCSSVLTSIPNFPMQIDFLPQAVCQDLNSVKIFPCFLWGDVEDKRKLHLCK